MRDEDIVYATGDSGDRDERTGRYEPLVYQLSNPRHRWVAMFGSDKR